MAAKATPAERLEAVVTGQDVLAYQPDSCPECMKIVYVPRMIEIPRIADWKPVERTACPHCGLEIVLVKITTPRLILMGADEAAGL